MYSISTIVHMNKEIKQKHTSIPKIEKPLSNREYYEYYENDKKKDNT